MPRGAARDVIKWAWSKFRARFARGILQPPLWQNPAYATVSYNFYLHVATSSVYCEVFRKYEFENNVGIMGWFERIIGEKFGNKRIE